jgi:hypothetical protein
MVYPPMFIPISQTQPNLNFISHCCLYQAGRFVPLIFTILQINLIGLQLSANQMFYRFFCFTSIKFKILRRHFLNFWFLFFILQFLFLVFYFFVSFLHILCRGYPMAISLFSFWDSSIHHYFFPVNQHFQRYLLLLSLKLIINH